MALHMRWVLAGLVRLLWITSVSFSKHSFHLTFKRLVDSFCMKMLNVLKLLCLFLVLCAWLRLSTDQAAKNQRHLFFGVYTFLWRDVRIMNFAVLVSRLQWYRAHDCINKVRWHFCVSLCFFANLVAWPWLDIDSVSRCSWLLHLKKWIWPRIATPQMQCTWSGLSWRRLDSADFRSTVNNPWHPVRPYTATQYLYRDRQ